MKTLKTQNHLGACPTQREEVKILSNTQSPHQCRDYLHLPTTSHPAILPPASSNYAYIAYVKFLFYRGFLLMCSTGCLLGIRSS